MQIKDFIESKEELRGSKKEVDKQIELCDERTRMSKINQFEFKAATILSFSMFSYFFLHVGSSFLIKTIGVTAFTNIIPALSYPAILAVGALGIGATIKAIIDKKFKTKEKASFSTGKTEAEKLEEEIQYQIELKKAENRGKVIDETIKILDFNESTIKRFSTHYDIKEKDIPKTELESKQKIDTTSLFIKEQYEQLDLLTIQKVLNEKFTYITDKLKGGLNTTILTLLTGLFTMFVANFPLIIVNDAIKYTPVISALTNPLVSLGAGIVGGGAYLIKRNKDYKKVFKKFNSKLEENGIVENLSYKNIEEIEAEIKNKIKEISLAEVQLKEYEKALLALTSENPVREVDNKTIAYSLDRTSVENVINGQAPIEGFCEPEITSMPQEDRGVSLLRSKKIKKPINKISTYNGAF